MHLERKLIFLMLKESSLYTLGLMNRTQENLEMSQEGFREEGIIRLPA